jgi:murein DD-endopeptidase MepM/ murein hydrolase activator NlpD
MRWMTVLVVAIALGAGGLFSNLGSSVRSTEAQEATPSAAILEEPAVGVTGRDRLTPVLASIIGRETAPVLASDGKYYVVYELLITNTMNSPSSLEAVTVLDADNGNEILQLNAEAMVEQEALRLLDREPAADAVLPANAGRILMLAVTFDSADEIPAALAHRIDTLGQSAFSTGVTPSTYVAANLGLSGQAPPVLSSPLRGEGWISAEGCCSPASHHVNGVFAINGTFAVGQRFAIDYIRIDDEGRLVAGDPSIQANWIGYRAPVLAVADGVVVSTNNELPNQVPTIMPDQSTMSLEEIEGNHVIIDHGNGLFTFYGHLDPGSVAVEVGEQVKTGDQLGLVGDSGGSQIAHLHFHVMDRANPAEADGYPFVFDSFVLAGQADFNELVPALEGEAAFPSRAELDPVTRELEMPLSYTIVDFPDE